MWLSIPAGSVQRPISRQEGRCVTTLLKRDRWRVGLKKNDVDAPRGPPELVQVVVPR